ncbi:hypothetical protein PR202_ga11918 [Eleusine coracana subsp. coracana]|uniref:Exocyst subunit Exo70 family protein n=1 Tax=Eleusine coracana subsp. coracana TaxID=191504 RepID=A0AAV5CAT5_ELECO|nr:hypothetical protein PR202_ga11918 [Eleusine coracana subsp. coracana]
MTHPEALVPNESTMQGRLAAEELRALRLDNKATPLCPGRAGADYSTSIQRVIVRSVAATSTTSLVFPSSGSCSSSSASTSLSSTSTGSAAVTSGSGVESCKLLPMEAFQEIASHMVNNGYIKKVIMEFCKNQSCSGSDAALQTWFSILGVDWVLGVHTSLLGEKPWSAVENLTKGWVVAFSVMAEVLRLARPSNGGVPPLWTDKNGVSRSVPQESADPARDRRVDDVATVKEATPTESYSAAEAGRFLDFGQDGAEPQNQFVIFAEASLMKMLRFPDAVAALKRSPEKILSMIDMYSVVSSHADLGLLLSGESKELVSDKIESELLLNPRKRNKLVSDRIESVLCTMSEAVCEILQNLKGAGPSRGFVEADAEK